MKYHEMQYGERIVVKLEDIEWRGRHSPKGKMVKRYYMKIGCCDCGLVHNIFITPDKGKGIIIVMNRSNRSTGQMRRWRKKKRKKK